MTPQQKLEINTLVQWTCIPYGYPDKKGFPVKGVIEKIYITTVGGRKKKEVAKIILLSQEDKYFTWYNHKTSTVISLDKLSKV